MTGFRRARFQWNQVVSATNHSIARCLRARDGALSRGDVRMVAPVPRVSALVVAGEDWLAGRKYLIKDRDWHAGSAVCIPRKRRPYRIVDSWLDCNVLTVCRSLMAPDSRCEWTPALISNWATWFKVGLLASLLIDFYPEMAIPTVETDSKIRDQFLWQNNPWCCEDIIKANDSKVNKQS